MTSLYSNTCTVADGCSRRKWQGQGDLGRRSRIGDKRSFRATAKALSRQRPRGAWMEIRVDEPDNLKKRLFEAGFPQVVYPATNGFYFAAPGGQVLGIVSNKMVTQPS
jgi:hypothetical protein